MAVSLSPTASIVQPLGESLDRRSKWLLLISLQMAMFVSALNQSLVSTATPRILADLGGFSLLSWVFTVYMVASTVVVLPIGRLSDMFGRRNFIVAGILIFVVGSLGCGVAQSMPQLIGARALQGIGGGFIFACVFATLGDIFPPAERGKYIGLFTGTFAMASILGPTIGGLLTDNVGWRWCFFVNVPVAAIAATFIWRNLPSKRKAGALSDIDFVGSLLLAGATICLLLALAWAQKEYGWGSTTTLGMFAGAAALTALFVVQERHHAQPIFPLGLFRNREFVLANLIAMLLGGAGFGAIQYLPTFVQVSLRASATASGLVTTPQSLGLLATSIIGGQILSRTGRYRFQILAGSVLILAATGLLSTLDVDTSKWRISAVMVLYGLGSGLVMPTMSVIIQNAVSHAFLGVATSSRQFFMQIGQVLGVAIFGVILANSYASSFHKNVPAATEAAIPAAVFREFDDPTLPLERRKFATVSAEVLALDNGRELLDSALAAQREGVATAIRHIFLGSVGIGALSLVLVLLMKELPLRRTFGPARERDAAPAAGAPAVVPVESTSLASPGPSG